MLLKVVSAFVVFTAAVVGVVLLMEGRQEPAGAARPGSLVGPDGSPIVATPPVIDGDDPSAGLEMPPRIEALPSAPAEKDRTNPPPAVPGIIEGSLRYAVTGSPVSGGRVGLLDHETGEPIRGPEGMSNAEGRFRLEPVLPGMYRVVATFKDERLRAAPASAHVDDGQLVDLGDMDVYRGVTITGRVVDIESKNPVARAEVTAWQPDAIASGDPAMQGVLSGPDGTFVLPGPFVPGDVYLTATHDAFAAREPAARWYLDDKDVTDAEIAVHRAWPLVGRVLTPDRSAAAATVELIAGSRRVCCVDTDADGQFVVDDALFELGLQSAASSAKIYAYAEARGFRGAFGEFTVDDIQRGIPRDIVLLEGGVVAGRLLGPDGAAMAGLRVTTWPEDGNRFNNLRDAITTADGAFRIAGLDEGPHVLEPQSPVNGLAPAARSIPFTIDGQSRHEAFEFHYQPGFVISGTATAVKDEAPMSERLVTLHHPEWLYPRETITDDDGAFSFDAIPEGWYTVSLRGYSWDDQRPPLTVEDVAAGTLDVYFQTDEEPEDGFLDLHLYNANTGRPITEPILLTLLYTRFGYPKNESLQLDPSADGHVTIEGLPRVDMRLVVDARGYARQALPASLTSALSDVAPELSLEVSLHAGREIGGRVTDALGHPIEGARLDARVALVPGEELPDGLGVSRLDGTFRLRTVSPEARFLTAVADGYAPAAAAIPPGSTPIQLVRIALAGGALVSGQAFYEDGSAAPGEVIQLAGAITTHYATTDPGGVFQFENVEDGPFDLTLPTGEPLGSGDIVDASPLTDLSVYLAR